MKEKQIGEKRRCITIKDKRNLSLNKRCVREYSQNIMGYVQLILTSYSFFCVGITIPFGCITESLKCHFTITIGRKLLEYLIEQGYRIEI